MILPEETGTDMGEEQSHSVIIRTRAIRIRVPIELSPLPSAAGMPDPRHNDMNPGWWTERVTIASRFSRTYFSSPAKGRAQGYHPDCEQVRGMYREEISGGYGR